MNENLREDGKHGVVLGTACAIDQMARDSTQRDAFPPRRVTLLCIASSARGSFMNRSSLFPQMPADGRGVVAGVVIDGQGPEDAGRGERHGSAIGKRLSRGQGAERLRNAALQRDRWVSQSRDVTFT